MDLGLTGRTAIVTGASRGIGLAITRGLAAHGAHVVAGARRSSAELDQLAKEGSVRVLEVDRATRSALPAMLAAGKGSIVTVCSVNAALPDPAVLDYSAAKAALAGFCKALSKEVGPHGVRVNTVSPGPVATDLWLGDHGVAQTVSHATGAKPEDVAAQAAQDAVTGRFSRPEEVADLVLLLASDRTANVTGADFRIDGGMIPTW